MDCNGDEDPIEIRIIEEHTSFELRGKPDTVVTVNFVSNFHRSPGADVRKLTVLLEATDGN